MRAKWVLSEIPFQPYFVWVPLNNKESGLREGMRAICVARVRASACHTHVAYLPFRPNPPPPLRSAQHKGRRRALQGGWMTLLLVENGQRTEQVKTGQVNPDRPLVGPSVDAFVGCFVGSP